MAATQTGRPQARLLSWPSRLQVVTLSTFTKDNRLHFSQYWLPSSIGVTRWDNFCVPFYVWGIKSELSSLTWRQAFLIWKCRDPRSAIKAKTVSFPLKSNLDRIILVYIKENFEKLNKKFLFWDTGSMHLYCQITSWPRYSTKNKTKQTKNSSFQVESYPKSSDICFSF